ncbi:MAG: right-handed parallel beta-helix repeat-containing protein [Clostridia bacterium]|nr:right-handed parallel beta-helix repeat-containing protein [Clostridia bacterium]
MIRLIETAETFDSLYEAREAVLRYAERASDDAKMAATLVLDAKEYRLTKPLIFDAEEAEALKHIHLSILCDNGTAVFTSNAALPTAKIIKDDAQCAYQFAANASGKYPVFGDLYEDDVRLPLCTSPHFTHAFAFSGENGRNCAENLEGIYAPQAIADLLPDGDLCPMTITLYVEWEFFTLHVLSVDRSRTRTDEQGGTHVLLRIAPDELYHYVTKMNASLQPKNRECFLSNHPVFLRDGTFCYDHTKGLLQFYPRHGLQKRIRVPMLEKLLVFNGMDGVTLRRLTFTGATDRHRAEHGYLSMQANVEKRGLRKVPEGAVVTNHTRGFTVSNCEFKELGVNGILMCGISARVDIHDNYFHDIAMSAISIGDPVKAFLAPREASFDLQIHRNHIARIAYDFPSAPAVDVFRVDGLSICHNTIEDTAYSAISVGWQWANVDLAPGEIINIRDAEIAYNKITRFMQLLRDGAAIYVVGANCARSYSRRFNVMHDNYAENDQIRPKVIGYYLDGASSHWTVWDNVILHTARPLYIQHNPQISQQFTWHNRAYHIYSTEEISMSSHHPERDTMLGTMYTAPTQAALFETYPKAQEIYAKAGINPNSDMF